MALANASIPVGATFSPTGGTARTIRSLGTPSNSNHKLFVDDSPTTLSLRKLVYATSSAPTPNRGSPDGFTQQRCRLEFQVPTTVTLPDSTTAIITHKAVVELSYSNSAVTADKTLLRNLIANAVIDADFDDFFINGSLT